MNARDRTCGRRSAVWPAIWLLQPSPSTGCLLGSTSVLIPTTSSSSSHATTTRPSASCTAASTRPGRSGSAPAFEDRPRYTPTTTFETFPFPEGLLDSADRVDVVFYGPSETVAVEVKSGDSNETDLRRGVFQCIKYRAVMEAMDIRAKPIVTAILVTQELLPQNLAALARSNRVLHFRAPEPQHASPPKPH